MAAVPWTCFRRGTNWPLTQVLVWINPPGEVCKGEVRLRAYTLLMCHGLVLKPPLLPLSMQALSLAAVFAPSGRVPLGVLVQEGSRCPWEG